MRKYKERCDICHEWHVCKGYEDKVLCNKCILKQKRINVIKIVGDKDGQARFDF